MTFASSSTTGFSTCSRPPCAVGNRDPAEWRLFDPSPDLIASSLECSAGKRAGLFGGAGGRGDRPLVRYCGGHLLPHEIARESQLLEVENLKLECGVQDQLASAYGGVNFMEVEYPNARIFPLHLEPSVVCELEDRLVLIYTGKSHFSSGMHQKVIAEADQHRDDFDTLAEAAVAGKEALLAADFVAFGQAMNTNWAAQKRLHPDITTPEMEAFHEAAFRAGALGFKANGAGGGGTVTILAERNKSHLVARAAQELGMTVLPALIDTTGLQVWKAE